MRDGPNPCVECRRAEVGMSERREFALGDVLCVSTGYLVSRRRIDAVYDVLNFLTRDNLFTHQLPRAFRECQPWVLRQHPQLASVDASAVNADNLNDWLAQQEALFGPALTLEPIPRDDHAMRDPLAELLEMAGDKPVIVVATAEPTDGGAP